VPINRIASALGLVVPVGRALASVLTITRNENPKHSLDNDERDSGNHQHYEEKTANAFAGVRRPGRKQYGFCNKEIQGSKNKNPESGLPGTLR